jgi:siderophore synthetase component
MTHPSVTTAAQLPTADEAVTHTLLNCLLREISGPEHQTAVTDGNLLLRLPRQGSLLRVGLRRTSLLGAHRFRGAVEMRLHDAWHPVGWEQLAGLIEGELSLRTGLANEEFLDQVRSTHLGVSSALERERPTSDPASGSEFRDSEQSLLFGHRFHPTPKARSGADADWKTYAPEAGVVFGLRQLAVRDQLVVQESADADGTAAIDERQPGGVPEGYTFLPAHPWQWELMRDRPAIQRALADGDLLDLGEGVDQVWPTSSVRTVCDDRGFLKFSLNVRITNCLRKNASYELTGAVALTRRLDPVAADLAERFPGTVLLREPAYRSVDLAGSLDALEGLAVIVREGLGRALPGTRVLLAAAVADEYPSSAAHVSRLIPDAAPERVLAWWAAYLRLLVPPVVAAYADHGVVFEPHLQNVLVAVDDDGMPVQVLLRDLEGTKLVPDHAANAAFLDGLAPAVAGPMTYDAQRGWDRVVYCLVVNHLAEMLAALADLQPDLEARLWRDVRGVFATCGERHPDDTRLRALLAGVPLPAKANLFTRWERRADRDAGYVRIASPLAAGFLAGLGLAEPAR